MHDTNIENKTLKFKYCVYIYITNNIDIKDI